jgi:hypothetical protein
LWTVCWPVSVFVSVADVTCSIVVTDFTVHVLLSKPKEQLVVWVVDISIPFLTSCFVFVELFACSFFLFASLTMESRLFSMAHLMSQSLITSSQPAMGVSKRAMPVLNDVEVVEFEEWEVSELCEELWVVIEVSV